MFNELFNQLMKRNKIIDDGLAVNMANSPSRSESLSVVSCWLFVVVQSVLLLLWVVND